MKEMKSSKGSRWHPARISGRQKFLRNLANQEQMGEKKKPPLEKVILGEHKFNLKGE